MSNLTPIQGIELPKDIYFTNTVSRKKEVFTPHNKGKATFYSCGPTVWNLIHIGNLRGGVVSDLVYRVLTKLGYEVTYVRNYTDIDDKIIKQAALEGCDWKQIAEKYIKLASEDYASAGCLPPTITPRATEYVDAMIESIETMIKKGHAYPAQDGSVFFNVSSFKDYGKLSKRDAETMESVARVEASPDKKNPIDFALWKSSKPGEPSWKSPWGEGRPGWHIECTSMVHKTMGMQIDLHHGGEDLIFPHHENEIAQAECSGSQSPFVTVWLHHAFLTLSNQKMSKSIGNVFQAHEFITQFSGEVARYLLLSVHYRSILDFSNESIDKALTELQRVYEAKAQAIKILLLPKVKDLDEKSKTLWSEFLASTTQTRKEVWGYFVNDLNTPGALGSCFTLIRQFNRIFLETNIEENQKSTELMTQSAQAFLDFLKFDMGEVLGFGLASHEEFFADFNRMKLNKEKLLGKAVLESDEIEKLIQDRINARANKDFKKSDDIRNFLLNNGVEIKDSSSGTTWSYK